MAASASAVLMDLDPVGLLNGVSINLTLFGANEDEPSTPSPSNVSSFDRTEMGLISGDYDVSDNDTDVSSDGGAHISMTNSNAEQLNLEMDMVDAEVMGVYNIASISPNSAFDADLSHTDNSLQGFGYDGQDYDGAEPHSPVDFDNLGSFHQPTLPMSQLSQQLEQVQNEQDNLLTVSAGQHGAIPTNGTSIPHLVYSNGGLELLSYVSDVVSSGGVPLILEMSPGLSSFMSGLVPPELMSPLSGPITSTMHLGGDAVMNLLSGSSAGLAIHPPDVGSGLNTTDVDVYDQGGEPNVNEANNLQVEDQRNLTLFDFLYSWGASATRGSSKRRRQGPNLLALSTMRAEEPINIPRYDLRGDQRDFQRIDWTKLEVSRREAREMRNSYYVNYTNLKLPHWHKLTLRRSTINNVDNFFKFQRMDFTSRISLAHFQLRNLLACTSRNSVYYAGDSRVFNLNPLFHQTSVKMDLTDPIVQSPSTQPFAGIQISTLAADHNVVMAGGFAGEYAMIGIDAPIGTSHVEGLVTEDPNPITNHIQIHLSRLSGLPQATFASNDTGLRVLDCTTNRFMSHQKFNFAVNCSAISPDHRLRVLVGDTQDVMICNAETGQILQTLEGHDDYGFACAWADNGWHVATGNQDKLIKIWDARMWTDSNGMGKPLQSIATTVAGARSLKFSPLGSGKRVLVAAESADMIAIIDAETYASKQNFDFYGETCGIDFSPDGQRLFVGVHDPQRGGIIEFEKCGFGQYQANKDTITPRDEHGNGLDRCRKTKSNMEVAMDEMAMGLDWRPDEETVSADPRSTRTKTYERRKAAFSYSMAPF